MIVVDHGSVTLNGGTMLSGTVVAANGASLIVNGSGTLDGVTVNGVLDVGNTYSGAQLTVLDGLVLNGTAYLGGPNSYYGSIQFPASQALGGNGTVVFGSNPTVGATGLRESSGGATLTIGAGITVRGQNGAIGYCSYFGGPANVAVINQGTISADVGGGTIYVVGQPVSNQGWLAMSNGGQLVVQGLAGNVGQIAPVAGSTLSLSGTYTNNLAINLTNATLNLSGNWVNAGSINLTNATVNLGSSFTTTQLGTFNRNGGTVNLTGTLNNSNAVLNLANLGGSGWRQLKFSSDDYWFGGGLG